MSATISSPRTARISPDRRGVGISVIVLVAIIMAAGYVFSFATIADAALWAGVPESAQWVRFTAPIFIDGAIITYTTAYAVHQWRRESAHARYARRILYFFTIVSVLVNGAHAASSWLWDFARYEAWVGVLIAIMAPIASLFSAEQMIKLAFEQGEASADMAPAPMVETEPILDVSEPLDADVEASDAKHAGEVDGADPGETSDAPEVADAPAEPVQPTVIAPEYIPDVEPDYAPDYPSEYPTDVMFEQPYPPAPEPEPVMYPEVSQPLAVDPNGFYIIPGRQAA